MALTPLKARAGITAITLRSGVDAVCGYRGVPTMKSVLARTILHAPRMGVVLGMLCGMTGAGLADLHFRSAAIHSWRDNTAVEPSAQFGRSYLQNVVYQYRHLSDHKPR
jgi:hypothetical protein